MMSSYEMRVTHAPKTSSLFGGLARFVSLVRDVLDVLTEAQRQAYEAERRHPFASAE
jgi:hypothetical protein